MSRITELFKKNPLTLIVSLPENSEDLARAAIAGGAHALKIHINLKHAAAETVFDSFSEERSAIEKILKASPVPVGIVPGDDILPTKEEMEEMIAMGIDFFDIKLSRLPKWMAELDGIGRVAAIGEDYSIEEVMGQKAAALDALEAAIIPKSGYKKELTSSDLQQYITIATSSKVPVIVPTQRAIAVSEVPILWDTGVKALMIGAVVTGKTPRSLEKAAKEFSIAVDDLG